MHEEEAQHRNDDDDDAQYQGAVLECFFCHCYYDVASECNEQHVPPLRSHALFQISILILCAVIRIDGIELGSGGIFLPRPKLKVRLEIGLEKQHRKTI